MTLPPEFIAAIKAAPDDDLPRLMAADWLVEHGEGMWAADIRIEIANPKLERREVIVLGQSFFVGIARRGFIESVTLPWDEWQWNSPTILEKYPIREVRLTTWPQGRDVSESMFAPWPGITFRLPPPRATTAFVDIENMLADRPRQVAPGMPVRIRGGYAP